MYYTKHEGGTWIEFDLHLTPEEVYEQLFDRSHYLRDEGISYSDLTEEDGRTIIVYAFKFPNGRVYDSFFRMFRDDFINACDKLTKQQRKLFLMLIDKAQLMPYNRKELLADYCANEKKNVQTVGSIVLQIRRKLGKDLIINIQNEGYLINTKAICKKKINL